MCDNLFMTKLVMHGRIHVYHKYTSMKDHLSSAKFDRLRMITMGGTSMHDAMETGILCSCYCKVPQSAK